MKNISLTQQAVQHLLDIIKEGNFSPGDKLPSENELAKNLGISRTIVREALASLKNDDIVEAKQGKGILLKDPLGRKAFRVSDVFDTISENEAKHLFEMRAVLEAEAAGLAALRLTEQGSKSIQEALEALAHTVEENQLGDQAHSVFNESIAKASGNPIIIEFLMFLRTKLQKLSVELRLNTMMSPERAHAVFLEHKSIAEAILARDPVAAKLAVKTHLEHAAQRAGLSIFM